MRFSWLRGVAERSSVAAFQLSSCPPYAQSAGSPSLAPNHLGHTGQTRPQSGHPHQQPFYTRCRQGRWSCGTRLGAYAKPCSLVAPVDVAPVTTSKRQGALTSAGAPRDAPAVARPAVASTITSVAWNEGGNLRDTSRIWRWPRGRPSSDATALPEKGYASERAHRDPIILELETSMPAVPGFSPIRRSGNGRARLRSSAFFDSCSSGTIFEISRRASFTPLAIRCSCSACMRARWKRRDERSRATGASPFATAR